MVQAAVDVIVLVTGVAETVMVLVVPGRVLTMVLGFHSLQLEGTEQFALAVTVAVTGGAVTVEGFHSLQD